MWVKNTILRGETFWDVRAVAVGSWIWKKLLELRPLAKQFMRMEVHSGKSVGFWTDLWHPMGRLIEVIGERGTHKLGIVRNASGWSSMEVKEFPFVLAQDDDDVAVWKIGAEEYGKEFSASNIWNISNSPYQAALDRLSTGTRRRMWGITQGCPFCGEPEELRDHLYFACPYTYGLWLQILARILGATRDRLASIFLRIALQVTVVGPNFGH
ncbi:uncharacterized protein LOC111208966 [Brassica napus]|uniref:uncharacterized protein LOC111208966 n=1 Tax=Brassica napus TaxID=3708 RepID=UPI000BBE570E|nr:uncharacterized protein LOC111208966 [Brassica napus]